MKVVIFAGGLGTRLSEETRLIPKPMVEIGGKPILWHIMKIYAHHGFHDFVICLGYKGHVIKEYFQNYFLHNSDCTFDLGNNIVQTHHSATEPFTVTLADTGQNTKTAGRLKRVQKYLGNEDFMLTYGDGVADIDLTALANFHKAHGKIATITAVQLGKQESRFGKIGISDTHVVHEFKEKPKDDQWINGGFFVLKPAVFGHLRGDADALMWEDTPVAELTRDNQLMAYKHTGFWKCMDFLRDKVELEEIWKSGNAPWKTWE